MIRRRKRRQYEGQGSRHATDFEGKAQLHADPFRSELDDENSMRKQLPSELQEDGIVVAELPSREPVGAEMDSSTGGTTHSRKTDELFIRVAIHTAAWLVTHRYSDSQKGVRT
jgi:hypothetical protein